MSSIEKEVEQILLLLGFKLMDPYKESDELSRYELVGKNNYVFSSYKCIIGTMEVDYYLHIWVNNKIPILKTLISSSNLIEVKKKLIGIFQDEIRESKINLIL